MYRATTISLLVSTLFLFAACDTGEPYFEGDGPPIDGVSPALDINGNLGGSSIQALIVDIDNPTKEEAELLANYIVTISGNFGDCADDDGGYGDLRVQFGARNATILAVRDDAIQVLTPPGPVSGGKVDLSVSCSFGASVVQDAYDYALGNPAALAEAADSDDESVPPRLEDLFENEYASFTLQYGAEPFINQPEPYGYGFFFNQPAPRASSYYGGNPGLMYAGEPADQPGSVLVLPQIPELAFAAPEQGDRIRAGETVSFFRERNTSDPLEILTLYARKRPQTNSFLDPDTPDAHSLQASNNGGSWMGVPYTDDDGVTRVRYLRIGNDIGRVCAPFNVEDALAPGCVGDEDEDDLLNDTRIPVDARWKWMVPDRPDAEALALYPTAAPEHIAYLDCIAAGDSEDEDALAEACEDEVGIQLPSGTYDDAFICRSFDEDGDFPWEDGGFCIVIEVVGEVSIEENGHYIDIPQTASGSWHLDPDSNFYGGVPEGILNSVGENVLVRGVPAFVSYDDGFYRGDYLPAKNLAMEVPAHIPPPHGYVCMNDDGDLADRQACEDGETVVSSYDETPYVEVAPIEYGSFFGPGSPFDSYQTSEGRIFGGFPILFDTDNPVDLRISLPGGVTSGGTDRSDEDMGAGGWDGTYFVITLEVRDIERPGGLDYDAVWRATAWAWAGDDYITFPAETLATMPTIGDIFRPDSEFQLGGNLLGVIRLQVHRTASWLLGDEFRDQAGRFVFDVSADTTGYFHNQHSCFDGIDNDGDGLCDVAGCDDENGNRLEADPACIPASPDDDQPEYETAVCSDGEDNDGDGLVDYAEDGTGDPDCTDPNDGFEDSGCIDGEDNDGDGWVDFPNDPGCESATSQTEGGYSYETDCNNGIDDDGDGRVDADDPGCEDALDDDETDVCADGLDNNDDGWVDWQDLTCRPGAALDYPGGENDSYLLGADGFECSDSDLLGVVDNDGDGLANADDPECLFGWDPSGEGALPASCEDNLDNDCDGWVDALDPQCASNPLSESVGGGLGGTCANGVDDDADGWIDALDPDCLSGSDDEIFVTTPLECNDGIDNDGDGLEDGADDGCWTGKDNHEAPHPGEAPEPGVCTPNEVEDDSCINLIVVLPNESQVSLTSTSCDDVNITGRAQFDASADSSLHAMVISYDDAGCEVEIVTNHCAATGPVPVGLEDASITVDLTNCFGIPEEHAQSFALDSGGLVVNEVSPTTIGPSTVPFEDQLVFDADVSASSSAGLEVYGVLNVDKLGSIFDFSADGVCD